MHLTSTNMENEKVGLAISSSKHSGVCNHVALQGDAPRGQEKLSAVEGGFTCALDLIRYIRKEQGDYFSIVVTGYPEGNQDAMDIVEGGLESLK